MGKMRRLISVLLILMLLSAAVSVLAEEQETMTSEEILAAYSGYEISDGILGPKAPASKYNKKLYQNGCTMLPALSLDKNTPFLMLLMFRKDMQTTTTIFKLFMVPLLFLMLTLLLSATLMLICTIRLSSLLMLVIPTTRLHSGMLPSA
jgi:hypothetical protein